MLLAASVVCAGIAITYGLFRQVCITHKHTQSLEKDEWVLLDEWQDIHDILKADQPHLPKSSLISTEKYLR